MIFRPIRRRVDYYDQTWKPQARFWGRRDIVLVGSGLTFYEFAISVVLKTVARGESRINART